MMLSVFPLGTNGAILPAIVVGYDVLLPPDVRLDEVMSLMHEHDSKRRALQAPPYLVQIDQQAGGYACRQRCLIGVVLRLESNRELGRRPSRDLLRGLHAMAEDPDEDLLEREFPVLAPLVGTCGEHYDEAKLDALWREVNACFEVPRFERGIESLIDCVECDPLEYFSGWRMLSFARDHHMLGYEPMLVEGDERFDKRTLDKLATAAHLFGLETSLRTFFLWENSD